MTMRKIKKYYRIRFKLTSPLSVGSGQNGITDRDIVLDGRGVPYIPGSALAGVYRHLFSTETANRYFGTELTEEKLKKSMKEGAKVLSASNVVVYDATIMHPEKAVVATRDMVELDEYKVAVTGAKFDLQVLEPGVEFVTYVEQNMESLQEQHVLEEIGRAWKDKKIQLGAKTGRGYGQTELVELSECCFDLSDAEQCGRWLDFKMYEDAEWRTKDEAGWQDSSLLTGKYSKIGIVLREEKKLCIGLDLKQRSGISVRQYSTNIDEEDYRQMVRKDNTAFIPGTTWAGAFRAQMGKLDASFAKHTVLTELFFGKVKGKEDSEGRKTRITFSESELDKGREEKYTRNSINRFSGGIVNGALYTEKSYFDGITRLNITCDITNLDTAIVKGFVTVLAATILDLDRGYMAVGGLTSVGHGLFEVLEVYVNGDKLEWKQIPEKEQFKALRNAIYREGEQEC